MTGDQSRLLKPLDRVCWGVAITDLGSVTGTSWSEVTISWDDGEASSVSHNDMARVERVPQDHEKEIETRSSMRRSRLAAQYNVWLLRRKREMEFRRDH